MRIQTRLSITPAVILRSRGLGSGDEARRFLAETVAQLCDPYVPMSAEGGAHMKNNYTIAADGSAIMYEGPYAHYQYVGEVMVGEVSGSAWAKRGEPKVGTGRPLHYNGGPMRGPNWDKRMMADRSGEVVAALSRKVGGQVR